MSSKLHAIPMGLMDGFYIVRTAKFIYADLHLQEYFNVFGWANTIVLNVLSPFLPQFFLTILKQTANFL